ncbi:hypothetical protein Q5M87_14205, partial [Brachyspira innocens]|uniref:hypothetical protein n=1 Tax=Brachyspira innocens TaxID=13264 RepID=UPI0026F2B20E
EEEIVSETAEPTNDYIKRMHEEYLNSQNTEDNTSANDDYISKFKNLHEEYVKEYVKSQEENIEEEVL